MTPLKGSKVPAAADYLRGVQKTRPRLVHSAAGEQALAQIRSDLLLKAEPLESALAGNPSAVHSATEPKARAAFFAEFEKRQGDLDYRRAADKYCLFYGKSVKQKAVACAKKLLRRG